MWGNRSTVNLRKLPAVAEDTCGQCNGGIRDKGQDVHVEILGNLEASYALP